jgi:hypothetical protein
MLTFDGYESNGMWKQAIMANLTDVSEERFAVSKQCSAYYLLQTGFLLGFFSNSED